MGTTYTVSDGKLMLILEPAESGWYAVTSPLDPQLITQARTLEEAFENAYDAREALIQARAEMADAFLRTTPAAVQASSSPRHDPNEIEASAAPGPSDTFGRSPRWLDRHEPAKKA